MGQGQDRFLILLVQSGVETQFADERGERAVCVGHVQT
jgi:hypothetical protein